MRAVLQTERTGLERSSLQQELRSGRGSYPTQSPGISLLLNGAQMAQGYQAQVLRAWLSRPCVPTFPLSSAA